MPGNPFIAQPFAQPNMPQTDKCNCAPPKNNPKNKKKKPKKRKPREVCYRGTYKQRSQGIDYTKVEEIPCEGKKSQNVRPKAPRLRLPKRGREFDSLKDLAGSIFQPTFMP